MSYLTDPKQKEREDSEAHTFLAIAGAIIFFGYCYFTQPSSEPQPKRDRVGFTVWVRP